MVDAQILIASIMASYNKEDWVRLAIMSEVRAKQTHFLVTCMTIC